MLRTLISSVGPATKRLLPFTGQRIPTTKSIHTCSPQSTCPPEGNLWKWTLVTVSSLAGGLLCSSNAEKPVDTSEPGDSKLDTSKLKCEWDPQKPQNAIHNPVVVVACGSFNPPTIMHLRMFELARDALKQRGYDVLGGYMSPVHDGYGKQDLALSEHRVEMCRLAVRSSDMVMVDDWEVKQKSYSRTRYVLAQVEEQLQQAFRGKSPSTKVMLLCGSDLLESMCTPGVWRPPDIKHLLETHGVICLARSGSDTAKFLNDSNSPLFPMKDHIIVIEDSFENKISSKSVREAVKNGCSIKYIVPQSVVDYVREKRLYLG